MHIKDVYRLHRDEIEALPGEQAQVERLVELNVIEQVRNLSHTSIVQNAWARNKRPTLHGWVYSIEDGVLQQLVTLEPGAPIDPLYRQEQAAG